MHKLWSFYKALWRNPARVGAAIPSSPWLAQAMAKQLTNDAHQHTDKLVIELGPGTGIITQALLNHGVRANQLLLIERSLTFSHLLHEQFPNLNIICADAGQLETLLHKQQSQIGAIVSSIPLLSLDPEVATNILTAITRLLPTNSLYLQYTYSNKPSLADQCQRLVLLQKNRIWRNIPPAWVKTYRKL